MRLCYDGLFSFAFQNFDKFKWYVLAYFLLNLIFVDFSQGRAEFLILALSYLILGNRFVYRTAPLFNLTIITSGVICFLLWGLIRGLGGDVLALEWSDLERLNLGEFGIIFGNSITMFRSWTTGAEIPLQVHLTEILSFIPSPMLPFQKVDYANWFLSEFYPDVPKGSGLMFGLGAQLVASGGFIAAIIRGFLLGFMLRLFFAVLDKYKSWWSYPALIYADLVFLYIFDFQLFQILTS